MTVIDNAREIATIKQEQKEIRKAVFGNGEPGMDENVRTIRTDLDNFIKYQKEKELEEKQKEADRVKERNFYIRAVAVLVITNLISIIGYAAFWFIRYAPIVEAIGQG